MNRIQHTKRQRAKTRPLLFNLTTITLLLLSVLASTGCTHRSNSTNYTLITVDSLINSDPLTALDILGSMDSTEVQTLNYEDQMFYTLLKSEAEYKSYVPISNSEPISDVIEFYKEKEDKHLAARALIIQGAISLEYGESHKAYSYYKEAESMLEDSDDYEQLGLINTRIGELYRQNLINDTNAIYYFSKALNCFRKIHKTERQASIHLALSQMLFNDSICESLKHADTALTMSRLHNNRQAGLGAWMIKARFNINESKFQTALLSILEAFNEYSFIPQQEIEDGLYNVLYSYASSCYAELNQIDSAIHYANMMKKQDAIDSINYFNAMDIISTKTGNWKAAYTYKHLADSLNLHFLGTLYNNKLYYSELLHENSLLKTEVLNEKLRKHTLVSSIVVGISLVILILIYYRLLLTDKESTIFKLVNDITEVSTELKDLKQRADDDDANISILRERIQQQEKAYNELMSLNGDLLSVTKQVTEVYYIYKDSTSTEILGSKIKTLIQSSIPKLNAFVRTEAMMDAVYPGLRDRLNEMYPWLSTTHKELISLMCCGYTTNSVSIIMGMDKKKINDIKTRLARKMGVSCRLSTYLRQLTEETSPSYSQTSDL